MADPHIEDQDTSWARTAKDLFSGAAGGVAQVLLGKSAFHSVSVSFILSIRPQLLCLPQRKLSHKFLSIFNQSLSCLMLYTFRTNNALLEQTF